MKEISWSELKTVKDSRPTAALQYIVVGGNYWIVVMDGPFHVECLIPTDPTHPDTSDFEANYKASGNQTPNSQVMTQFEKRDKTLKLVCACGVVQSDGTVVAYLKVPGTPNPTGDTTLEGRWISSGVAFFDTQTPGDIVTGVRFVDHDNIPGQGIDFAVGSYTDDYAPSENQGWYVPPVRGQIDAETIGGYGFAAAGFYVMVTAKKGGGITAGTLYVNFEWGRVET